MTCTECSASVPPPPSPGRQPLTCSIECRRQRLNRMRNERKRKPLASAECVQCQAPFLRASVRGAQRLTCSDECSTARRAHQRQTVRRERYHALVAAGAYPAVASDGSQGPRAFAAALAVLAEAPELRRQQEDCQ